MQFVLIDHPLGRNDFLQSELTNHFRNTTKHRLEIEKAVNHFKKRRRVSMNLYRDLEYCLRVVKIEGTALRKLRNQNREVVLEAVKQNANSFSYVRKEFRKDLEILLNVFKTCSKRMAIQVLREIDVPHLSDVDSLRDLLCIGHQILENPKIDISEFVFYLPVKLLSEEEFVMSVVRKCKRIIPTKLFEKLKDDREFILTALKSTECAIDLDLVKLLSLNLINDKEMALEIVKKNALSIEYVPRKLQAERDVIHTAVRQNGITLMFAHPPHNDDVEICRDAWRSNEKSIDFMTERVKHILFRTDQ